MKIRNKEEKEKQMFLEFAHLLPRLRFIQALGVCRLLGVDPKAEECAEDMLMKAMQNFSKASIRERKKILKLMRAAVEEIEHGTTT